LEIIDPAGWAGAGSFLLSTSGYTFSHSSAVGAVLCTRMELSPSISFFEKETRCGPRCRNGVRSRLPEVVVSRYRFRSRFRLLAFGRTAIYKYGASDKRFPRTRANNLLMWEAIRCTAGRGINASASDERRRTTTGSFSS
jgi:hypothetical protein